MTERTSDAKWHCGVCVRQVYCGYSWQIFGLEVCAHSWYASQISLFELMQQMLQWIKFCFDMLNFIWQSDCTLNYCGSSNLNASNIWHRQQRESPAFGSHAWSTQWNYLTLNTFQQRAVEDLYTSHRFSMASLMSFHPMSFQSPTWILEESENIGASMIHNGEPFMKRNDSGALKGNFSI